VDLPPLVEIQYTKTTIKKFYDLSISVSCSTMAFDRGEQEIPIILKGLSYEIDFENVDEN
jgi:hypothetical protein